MNKWLVMFVCAWLLAGCAGWERSCSSCGAQNFGADWVVVQMDLEGKPFRCWKLSDTSISNEESSDGIYWVGDGGNLVHISGLYNRVQVEDNNWDQAFAEVGLSEDMCLRIQTMRYNIETNEFDIRGVM